MMLKGKIAEELKIAMKAGDNVSLEMLRLIRAAL